MPSRLAEGDDGDSESSSGCSPGLTKAFQLADGCR